MKIRIAVAFCSALIGLVLVSPPSFAQQKTVKACQSEWRAHKAAYQAADITEKAYVEKCRAGVAVQLPKGATTPATAPAKKAASSPARGKQRTVKACEAEWRVNKAAYQAAGITEKAYVEKCRAGVATPVPSAAKPATTPAPSQAKPTTTAPRTHAGTPGAGSPAGPRQYATEAQAKARCPTDTVVWVNLESKIYHFSGYKAYGHTKSGAYMCERDTTAAGFRAAKNEKHP